jgi:leader peptidase (prepilin peptidase)/N-methyltransferase
VLIGAAILWGLMVGSFLNVVVHRVPLGESILRPGSHCPQCGHVLGPLENVPLLSWLALRGRCRGCGSSISARYPLVELATGLVFGAAAWRWGATPDLALMMLLATGLVAAALIDFEHRFIPDGISLGGLAAGLVLAPTVGWLNGEALVDGAGRAVAGAVLGGGLLWLVGFVHARVSVALGRTYPHWPGEGEALPRPKDADYWLWFPGMGLGDVKLMAAIGAFLGPAGVLETIVAASLLGLLLGLAWAAVTRDSAAPFGFGPAIALGALAVALIPHPPLLTLFA